MAKVRMTLCSNANRTIQTVILLPSAEWSEATRKLLKAAAQSKLRLKNPSRFFDEETGAELLPGSFLQNDMIVLASSGGDYIGRASPSSNSDQAQCSNAIGALTVTGEHLPRQNNPAVTVKLIASRAEVASSAVEQLKATAKLPGMLHAIGMPDLHPGANSSPVGAAFITADVIYPSLIGPDIGCGMRLYQLPSLPRQKLLGNISGYARHLKGLDLPVGNVTAEMWLQERGVESTPFDGTALGTIGGGNHFAELQVVQEVRDEGAFRELGLSEMNAFLLVHSGSRGFGKAVLERFEKDAEQQRTDGHGAWEEGTATLTCPGDLGCEPSAEGTASGKEEASEDFGGESQVQETTSDQDETGASEDVNNEFQADKTTLDKAGASEDLGGESPAAQRTTPEKVHFAGRRAAGVPAASSLGESYLLQHNHACAWAKANRELIASRLLSCLNIDLHSSAAAELVFDVWHNNVERLPSGEWVHRKGAAPADKGPVMIPGSRGTASYLVKPKTQCCSVTENGLSLAHGGGRRWTRAEAVRKLRGRVQKKGEKEGGAGAYKVLREELLTNSFGGIAICDDKELVYEEAADAYKCIEDVVADLDDFCEIVAVFAPIISYKVRHA